MCRSVHIYNISAYLHICVFAYMCISVTDESVMTGPGVRPGPGPGPGPGPVDWDNGKVDKTMSQIEPFSFAKKQP